MVPTQAVVRAGQALDNLGGRHLQREEHVPDLRFSRGAGDVPENERLPNARPRHEAEHLARPDSFEDVVE
jgi:hypothetical protein